MIFFKDKWEMRRWIVEKMGTGWSNGHGPKVGDIIDEIPGRPPYMTDWSAFLETLPHDLENLVWEKRHLAKPKKDFIAVLELEAKKTKVLGVITERDKNDCFREVYKLFPELVTSQAKVVIKTKSELKVAEKRQLEELSKLP